MPQPTRDVLVTRDHAGEREFSGFGAAQNDEYADCFIDASHLPEDTIKVSADNCLGPALAHTGMCTILSCEASLVRHAFLYLAWTSYILVIASQYIADKADIAGCPLKSDWCKVISALLQS